jgi:hypothetical protein
MANIFRVYKDSQVTTDRIRAEAAADSIVTPERVVYVFGTADDVAPNFTTVDGALTYARSLVPDPDEPVVIRLFTKLDGTPYDLDGGDSWIVYAFESIYIYSDFKRLNTITDEVPTSLPAGLTVWYIDPNGVETLWVGREDGSAWPAVGYKEYVALVTYNDATNTIEADVLKNTLTSTAPVVALVESNGFSVAIASVSTTNTVVSYGYGEPTDTLQTVYTRVSSGLVTAFADVVSHGELFAQITIKVYP